MKTVFRNILNLVGLEWVVKTVMISALEAIREVILESETTWDDKVALAAVDGLIQALKAEPPR